VSAKHAGIIKKYQLGDVRKGIFPLSAGVRIWPTPDPRLCGRPLWTAPYAD